MRIIIYVQSGLNSVVIAPGSPRPASYTNNLYSTQLTNDPSPKCIWDGDDLTAACDMSVTVQ
jgi:hypothetical protein